MKINIQKFSTGGQTYFSAIPNPYARGAEQEIENKGTSSKSEDDELVPKAVLNELLKNGLPNDVDAFMRAVAAYQKKGFGSVDSQGLYALLSQANTVIKNSDFLKKAEETAIQNNSLDEIAISPKSEMFVIDKENQIKKVHITKFDSKKHQAMTIGELLEYRKYAPELTFNTEIATVTANSVGLEKIQDYIKQIIQTIGTNENTIEAYSDLRSLIGKSAKKPTQDQLQALQDLSRAEDLGDDALFAYKDKLKSKNVQSAFKYILSILPNNMRSQLLANGVADGMTYAEASSNAAETIWLALSSANSVSQDYSIKYDQALNKAAKTTAGQQEDTRRQTTVEMFFNQNLNRVPGGITISDPRYKNQIGLIAQGTVLPSLAIDGGTGIGSGPLSDQLEAGGKGMGKYLDMSKIWIGYDRSYQEALSQIYYQGDQVANVWLPTVDGEIDWESVASYSQAEEEIKLNNITDPEQKNKIHAKYGSPIQYAADGSLSKNSNVENFMMIHGYTTDNLLSSDNLMYRDLDKDREKLLKEQVEAINRSNKKSGIQMDTPGWFSNFVEVPIFIKVQPNAGTNAAYYARQGSQVPEMSLQDDMTQQMLHQQPQVQIYGNAAALYGQQ